MSTPLCQHIQQRILDKQAAGLGETEREHLRACPDCRAFAQDVLEAGTSLAMIAEQINRQPADELPRELKQRVMIDILETLDREAKGEKPKIKRPVQATLPRPSWLDQTVGVLVRWRWAMAAALVVIALGAGVARMMAARNIGQLEFASGHTELRTGSAQTHEGVGNWTCQRGSTLTTDANAGAFFSLGKDVRVAMAGDTSLKILEREKFTLAHGSVWLSVEPGGKGFVVDTPFARVQVTGTHFGVTVNDREARVEVIKGSVVVSQSQGQGTITAGQSLDARAGGLTAPSERKDGNKYPAWVLELHNQEKLAYSRHYLPSIGKRK